MGVIFNPLAAKNPVVAVLAVATLLLNLALIEALMYILAKKTGLSQILDNLWHERMGIEFSPYEKKKEFLSGYFKEISFVIALTATSGSLYMSNVLGWEPCQMCWFQRIFMYPLVIVLGVGLLFGDENTRDYAIPLALLGLPIALYHSIVQRFSQFQSAGCSVTAVSCSTEYTFWFGYITIPVMAATAFAVIILLMWRFGRD